MTQPHADLEPKFGFGTRIRTSPYFEATIASGATHFTTYNHMFMPVSYGDPAAEYRRLTETAALWDVAGQRQIAVTGPDAAVATQLLVTRDIGDMKVLRGKYAPMCDHDGRLLNDPLLLRRASDEFWLSIADNDVLPWVRAIVSERGLDASVAELDVAPLAVQGPVAEDVVASVCGDSIRDLPFFSYRAAELDGIPILVGRAGWSKQGGFELYLLDSAHGEDLWWLMMKAGEPFGVGPGAPNAVERIESGLFSLRADNPDDANPFELGLGRWVEIGAGVDFIGAEALAELSRQRQRHLVRVEIAANDPRSLLRPLPLFLDGGEVGTLRAVGYSSRHEMLLGVAFVNVPAHEAGVQLSFDTRDGSRRAVVLGPFERPMATGGG